MSFLSQKLACLLYKAADDGDVDPFLVFQILGVTKDETKMVSVNDQNHVLTLPPPTWRKSGKTAKNSDVIPGRAHRLQNGSYPCRMTTEMPFSARNLASMYFYLLYNFLI